MFESHSLETNGSFYNKLLNLNNFKVAKITGYAN